MHVGHLLTRAAQRWTHRPAWLEGDAVVTFREAEASRDALRARSTSSRAASARDGFRVAKR
jgi:hypothetical protein